MIKKYLVLSFFIFLFSNLAFAEESITITTYYPSPYGSYNNLTTNNLTAPNNVTLATQAGSMVGIGTASPGAKLQVYGDTQLYAGNPGNSPKLYFGSETNAPAKAMYLENYYIIMQPHRNEGLKIRAVDAFGNQQLLAQFNGDNNAAASQIWLAPTGGRVGIGTTNPTGHMLDVASTAGTTGNSAIRALYPGGGGLTNTEFAALAHRGGIWVGVYGKQGSSSYAAYFDGAGYLNAAAWTYGSDKRLKENIEYLTSGLNIVKMLKPAKFDYIKGEKKQVGFIAQDIQEILPDIVTKGTDGMLGVKTDSIIPYLVKAIQEQQEEMEYLKREILRLKAKSDKDKIIR